MTQFELHGSVRRQKSEYCNYAPYLLSAEDTDPVELQTKVPEYYAKFYNQGEGPYWGLLLVESTYQEKGLARGIFHVC